MKREEAEAYKQKLEGLMAEAIAELQKIGIVPSSKIRGITLNTRAKKRLGCCKKKLENLIPKYEIEVSLLMMDRPIKELKEVILHELLHTCKGCLNHGKQWKEYAARVSEAYGYSITTTVNYPGMEKSPLAGAKAYRYKIVCKKCGATSYRTRRSRVVDRPELYQCSKCNGRVKAEKL